MDNTIYFDTSVNNKSLQDLLRYHLKFYFADVDNVEFDNKQIKIHGQGAMDLKRMSVVIHRFLSKFSGIPQNFGENVLYDSRVTDVKKRWKHVDQISGVQTFKEVAERMICKVSEYIRANKSGNARCIHPVAQGLNIYTHEANLLFSVFDDFIKEYFETETAAVDVKVPSIISMEVIERAGYFETGCQHISFAMPVTNDPDMFEQFTKRWNEKNIDYGNFSEYLKKPEYIMNPALCLHCYPYMSEKEQKINDMTILTVMGNCFRDESGNLNNAERLKEFAMREVIYFGSSEKLQKEHVKLLDFLYLMAEFFGFTYKIEAANDIFFNSNAEKQLFSQLISSDKIELSVYCKSLEKFIAIASVNKHYNHFSKSFNLVDTNDVLINTMCIGFGYNRLLYALLDANDGDLQKVMGNLVRNLTERIEKQQ